MIAGQVGDHAKSVDEAFAGGDVAPLEVLRGHPPDLVIRQNRTSADYSEALTGWAARP